MDLFSPGMVGLRDDNSPKWLHAWYGVPDGRTALKASVLALEAFWFMNVF